VSLAAILALGFLLGMRHATDADHVVAVSAIVSRERRLSAAAPVGILWGLGHTVSIFVVGGAIILFGIVIPPHVGLGMELSVACMLVLLGGSNLRSVLRESREPALAHSAHLSHAHVRPGTSGWLRGHSLRPLLVGIVHGLAGSAAVALLVLGTIRDTLEALGYVLVFGVGTIAGMLLITTAFAVPVASFARRFERFHGALGTATGLLSIAFGALLVYQIGFVHGLFTGNPQWTPQ
jgi:hypothetical protein